MATEGRKRLVWGVVALGAAALLIYGFWPQPVQVDLAEIGRGDVKVVVEDEGVSQVREVYRVSAPVSGTVQRSPVEIGDPVIQAETVVASLLPAAPGFLDTRSARMSQANVEAAEAALRLARANAQRAEAEAKFWRKQLARIERLRVGATVTERTVDQTRMEANARIAAAMSAQAEVDLRRKELEAARAALIEPTTVEQGRQRRCCLKIPAPVDGVVLNILNESEAVVQVGTPLIEIGDPHDLEIVAELLSRDAVRVEPGARAQIGAWGGPPLQAKVRRIDSAGFTKVSALGIEEQRVKVWLDLTVPPEEWARLGHDYRVIVSIIVNEAKNVVRVPVAALFRQGEDWAVYVNRNGKALLTPIRLGARNFDWAEVIDGLTEKDEVILYPSDSLADKVSVTRRNVE